MVTIAYRLFDEAGAEVDRVDRRRPLRFVHGYAEVLPGLEAGLEGARAGERRSLVLSPADAFGPRDPEGVLEVDREELSGSPAAGDEVAAMSPEGIEVSWRVLEVRPDVVVLDVNHPLAGQRVRFEVRVCEVRGASEAEIERARAELGQRIVDDAAIGYSCRPTEAASEAARATGTGAPGRLVQLRPPRQSHEEET
jgi:FKBP-type peptidyl-prolyl cis-trans isomerase SlyD